MQTPRVFRPRGVFFVSMGTLESTTERLLELFDAGHGICTDSRKVKAGDLYFALKGERFDGNDYALSALEAGAEVVVVDSDEVELRDGVVKVGNGLKALQDLARAHRRRMMGTVIGLTGSNGKTTTKELLYSVLSRRFRTHATQGNLNNHIGVPLTLLSMPLDTEVAIVEMGANHVGEIRELAAIAEPDLGLITNIGLAHLEGFGGPEGVKRGKRELFEFIARRPEGRVFVHAGQPVLLEVSEGQTRTLFGTPEHLPQATSLSDLPTDWEALSAFLLHTPDGTTGPHPLHMDGAYNLDNALAALTIGAHLGVSWTEGLAGLASYHPTNNRSQWVVTPHNRVLLDAYNANPSSMESALRNFAAQHHNAPLAILGDMAELGAYSEAEHRRILDLALELGLQVWTVGPAFAALERTDGGLAFLGPEELIEALDSAWVSHRTILLKGSRSVQLEVALPLL